MNSLDQVNTIVAQVAQPPHTPVEVSPVLENYEVDALMVSCCAVEQQEDKSIVTWCG